MAIRANQLQVRFCVVRRISVYMVCLKRNLAREQVPLIPSADTTLLAVLLNKKTLNVFGKL